MLVGVIEILILHLLLFIDTTHTVSIRRRKHLFGQQWDPHSTVPTEQRIGSSIQSIEREIGIPTESEGILPANANAVTIRESTVNETKEKRGRPKSANPKSRKKSTEAAKAWHARKREAFLRGEPEAIEFYTKRNQSKAAKARQKTARIQDGIATIDEQESYKRLQEKQKDIDKINIGVMILLYFYMLLLLTNNPKIYGVSIRRRKHLFGERQEHQHETVQTTNQAHASTRNTDVQPRMTKPSVETSTSSPSQAEVEQNFHKNGKNNNNGKKSKKGNIGVGRNYNTQKSWYERQKEARDNGDPKAIAFFKKIHDNKARKLRERNERIRNGTATEKDQKQYLNYRANQNRHRSVHRQAKAEYLRQWRAKRKKEKVKDE